MADKYIPLISSGVAGPLGVLHLPRLWQKVSLESQSKLADGYPGIGKGYDAMVLEALNLDPDAVRNFIAETKPTYPQFEAWVKARARVKLDRATIDKSNRAILGYNHDDATRQGILKAAGVLDGNNVNYGAVDLNNLEDWGEFHRSVLAPAAPPLAAELPEVANAEVSAPAEALPAVEKVE